MARVSCFWSSNALLIVYCIVWIRDFSMQATITGKAFVLGDNVDTDQIIPAQYLTYNPSVPEEYKMFGKHALSSVPPAQAGLPKGHVPSTQKMNLFPTIRSSSAARILAAAHRANTPRSPSTPPASSASSPNSTPRIFFRNSVTAATSSPSNAKTGSARKSAPATSSDRRRRRNARESHDWRDLDIKAARRSRADHRRRRHLCVREEGGHAEGLAPEREADRGGSASGLGYPLAAIAGLSERNVRGGAIGFSIHGGKPIVLRQHFGIFRQ